MLAKTKNFAIRDDGEVEFTDSHLFELFPAKFGYATNIRLNSGEQVTIEKFNKPYMK